MTYARIESGVVVELFTPPDGIPITDCFASGMTWISTAGADPHVDVGWTYNGFGFIAPVPVTPPVVIHYVPVFLARERLEAAGKWDALVAALATDMPRLIKLLTLAEGLDPADAEVRGVLSAIGADPDAILAS